jgi:hypothetical protein
MKPGNDAAEPLETLIPRFREAVRSHNNRGRSAGYLGLAVLVSVFTIALVFPGAPGRDIGSLPLSQWPVELLFHNPFGAMGIGGLVIALGFLWWQKAATRKLREAVQMLVQSDDVRVIGSLLEARRVREQVTRNAAVRGLTRLLCEVGPEHYDLLDGSERYLLHRTLCVKEPELSLSALKALRYVGNRNSLWYVKRCESKPPSSKGGSTLIHEAAVEARRCINERVQLEHTGQSLLRPAGCTEPPTADLLRAVEGAGLQPEAQLLRPHASAEE